MEEYDLNIPNDIMNATIRDLVNTEGDGKFMIDSEEDGSFSMKNMYCKLMQEGAGLVSASCNLCGSVCESTLHVLRDCSFARRVWDNRIPGSIMQAFFGTNLQDWIHLNIMAKPHDNIEWCNYWATGCHLLWTWRNKEKHTMEFQRSFNFIATIENNLNEYKEVMHINHCTMDIQKIEVLVKWSPPMDGVFKLNTDGSRDKDGLAGCRGVIRDARGEVDVRFYQVYWQGKCDNGIIVGDFEGLKLAVEFGFSKVEVNTDSTASIEILSKAKKKMNGTSSLEYQIMHLMAIMDCAEIVYACRELNGCANALAKEGILLKEDCETYWDPPDFMLKNLKKDLKGVLVARSIVP
ncbi:uncharacterized protein LOC131605224 [Vicia villosa]|uniref:uncharacterized protein LOC131605224 n=1 Tax=Vicia villosa TaxID=3911 RepID=UPI00273B7C40|nr:uncharacterized protein LOC131605224 [Vicia villosa]